MISPNEKSDAAVQCGSLVMPVVALPWVEPARPACAQGALRRGVVSALTCTRQASKTPPVCCSALPSAVFPVIHTYIPTHTGPTHSSPSCPRLPPPPSLLLPLPPPPDSTAAPQPFPVAPESAMATTSSQYLEVPTPAYRKSRSRSRSRPQEVRRSEAVASSSTPFKSRPQSPPMPSPAEISRKPSLTGFSSPKIKPRRSYENIPSYPISIPSPPAATQDVKMAEADGTNYDDLNGGMYTLEQCMTPPPEVPLRQKLVGTWRLESYTAYPTPSSTIQRPTFPMTKNVTGFIMYTPDGYMSAQFLIPGQQAFQRGQGDEAQWAEAGKRFFAYSGPYYISSEGLGREEVLRHTFQVCNLPGWVGDIQIRTHRFEEDGQVLVLGSEEPSEIKVCLLI